MGWRPLASAGRVETDIEHQFDKWEFHAQAAICSEDAVDLGQIERA
jgi:hypothetical protein